MTRLQRLPESRWTRWPASATLLILLVFGACTGGQTGDDGGHPAGPSGDDAPHAGSAGTDVAVAPPGGNGGAAGTGGGGVPEVPPPVGPGPSCEVEESAVQADETTVYGVTAAELVADSGTTSALDLHWVPFDAIAGTTYEPGPGTSTIRVELELADGDITQIEESPFEGQQADYCRGLVVRVPVWATVTSGDGALDERFATELEFTTAASAHFSHELSRETLAGSFAVNQIEDQPVSESRYEFVGLYFDVQFWPGGSAGRVEPQFELRDPEALASPPSSAPGEPPAGTVNELPELVLPSSWHTVAVWPLREQCQSPYGRVPHAADARVLGISAQDVARELNQLGPWGLGAEGLPVRFTVEEPAGTVCVSVERDELVVELFGQLVSSEEQAAMGEAGAPGTSVVGTAGSGGGAGTPTPDPTLSSDMMLANLDARSLFEIRARVDPATTEIVVCAFARRDVVYDLSREELWSQTHLQLDPPEEYERFWWSWHGTASRDVPAAAFARSGQLVVTSLNAEQSAEVDRIVAAGGPGAGIGFDNDTHWPELPGDELLCADVVAD